MMTVTVSARSSTISLENAWILLTDIQKFPQRVKYVKKVIGSGVGGGSVWYDVTSILFFPIKLKHIVKVYKVNEEYTFDVVLPEGAFMKQSYQICKEKKNTILVKGVITYDFKYKILNNTVGLFLKPRLYRMLVSAFRNIDGVEV